MMENDSCADWSVTKFASMVNLSPSRLRHLFKQETGKSPTTYLKAVRLRQAEVLLRETFFSVKEIVSRVGLGSGSHFVREFKRVHGTSPTSYRRAVMAERRRTLVKKHA
jgi:AraC-like DNA-binding protein